ncbi:copper-translocating P-t [Decorospora gaudefroyi]|uniref:Copper-translocating P-t n=1 Tax=Decorospora gaudefroyi TaxID=184978 RepID=A0A6A5JZQ0_9PLEO|nr:copper-translocating P-t [Decorospora gaudefroyi]
MACGGGCCGSKDPVASASTTRMKDWTEAKSEWTPLPEPSPVAAAISKPESNPSRCLATPSNSCSGQSWPTAIASVPACCNSSPRKPVLASCCTGPTKQSCCNSDTPDVSDDDDDCVAGCCESRKSTPVSTKSIKDAVCCTSKPTGTTTARTEPSCCASSEAPQCCTDKKSALVGESQITTASTDYIDVEKGSAIREHVAISISGMTCTGCETKLKRTLGSLSYVSNLQTSLVLARIELDINASVATPEDVIKHLHRTTEFKCERISNRGSSVDLVCSSDPATLIKGDLPVGVLEVRLLGKQTIRVDYDADIVGARDLLADGWSQSLRLAPPSPDSSLDAGRKHVRHMGLLTLLSAVLTIPVLVMAWAPLPEREMAYGSASLALATVVQVVIAGPFYPKAIKALVFSKVIEMDLLIVLSTSAAYIFSVVSFVYLVTGNPLSTGEFFETSTLLVTLIMVGRWVASLARQKAAESISIRSLQTPTAILLVEDGKVEKEIDARLLQYGDILRVAPDSRIPTDGTVISGSSEIDESMLTGESKPVEKRTGSMVIAGSVNGSGTLTVRLTRLPGDNTITTIASMVDEAKLSKPKIQDIADTVASYFVPVVVTLTIITFSIWVAIGITVRHQSGSEATIAAITYAITVLIVSCPCAIGLAVPMVIVVASGVAAKRGVVFKSAGSIEVAYKTTDVVFDKTGTLTTGQLAVVREEYLGIGLEETKSRLVGLLANVKHPVSAAIAAHIKAQGFRDSSISDAKVITGKGVQGTSDGKVLRAGNSRWLGLADHAHAQSMLSDGLSTFCFTIDDELVAVFGLQDSLRPDAFSTIEILQQRGINVHILSGDDEGAVSGIASQLNVPNGTVRSRCSPSDKQAYIKALLEMPPTTSSTSKPRKPVVMYVGDGTNDAVALAQATVGVFMSSGTDIAQSAADVVLMRPSLSGVLTIINVSRKAMHRVAFNFGWSFVYNLFAVLLGAGAFVHVRIPPEFAGLGEFVSVLPVILAAILLKWSRL